MTTSSFRLWDPATRPAFASIVAQPPSTFISPPQQLPHRPLENITARPPPALVADLRSPYTLLTPPYPPHPQDSLPLPADCSNNDNIKTLCCSSVSFSLSSPWFLWFYQLILSHSLSLSLSRPHTCNLGASFPAAPPPTRQLSVGVRREE